MKHYPESDFLSWPPAADPIPQPNLFPLAVIGGLILFCTLLGGIFEAVYAVTR